MLYQKYRPRQLQEVDNSRVRALISKYLSAKDIPHAWLFTGHKGMGKTSLARILAKELCSTGDAKLDARIHTDIDSGVLADVQEINGADNTGIDDVRKLIETISYAPMLAKYRMYIIDEVHMLSSSAFNGLLKVLEEPPSHAIFVLATTALDKIPATIQSRCVRVDFGLAKEEDVIRMLDRIAKGEGIQIPDTTKKLIADNCDRSFRDATKILEELIAQSALDEKAAQHYLGVRSRDKLLAYLAERKASEAIKWLYEFTADNGDPKLLIEDTIRRLHAMMLRSHGIEPDYPIDDVRFSTVELIRLLRLFHDAYTVSRSSPVPASAIQIAIIEYCREGTA